MTLRLALIGAGVIGKRHMAAIADTEGAELAAIADPSPVGEIGSAPLFADAAAMLAEIRPDGVIVATPTTHHQAPVLAALAAGAHVLVEKPITATLSEAETLVARSAATGLHVLAGHHRRYYPAVHKARELVRSGALGSFLLSDATPSPWAWELATGENPAFPRSGLNACRFMGTAACLDFPNLTLWRHRPGEAGWNHALEPAELPLPLGDAFASQCAHFCAVIRGDETPRITARDATKTLCATLAVLESAQGGRRVVL